MKGLVTLPTVLKRFGISRATAYRWIAEGYLPTPVKKKPGRTAPIFFRKAELDALAERIVTPRKARRR